MLCVFLVLNGPALVVRPANRPLLRGWKAFSSPAIVSRPDLTSSHESAGAQKTMEHKPTQLSMRAFRVVSHQGGLYHKWLIVEDTVRAQFQFVAHSASGYRPTKDMKATIDRKDAWNVLNSLREAARIAETGSFHSLTADSIDGAIAQQQTQWQELEKHLSSQAMTSTSVQRRDEPTGAGKRAKPRIRVIRGPELSEEERQQMIDEVWDFAAGMHLEWRAGRRTPAGHKCEVLTFDGSEKVLVHLTSLEIPSRSK